MEALRPFLTASQTVTNTIIIFHFIRYFTLDGVITTSLSCISIFLNCRGHAVIVNKRQMIIVVLWTHS